MGDEGYLMLATGPAKYVGMARNLAASVRLMAGTRPICLVHDEDFSPDASDQIFFDDYAMLPNDARHPGFMNKLRVFPTTPYCRTMFVDADCLLLKRDIDTYWEMTRPYPFAITGSRRTRGERKGADIAQSLRQEGAPCLVQMNSGVFCFDKSPEAATFFEGLNDFYIRRHEKLGVGLHRGQPAQTDEIHIGLWMGLNGLDSCGGRVGENSRMVSTWRAFWMTLEPERGISILRKPRRSIAGIPTPLGGWDRISPSFVPFVGLQPARPYKRLTDHFRATVLAIGPTSADGP